MTELIPINIAVEDQLSEAVVRKLLAQSSKKYFIGSCYTKGGFGYLKNKIAGFNNASASGTPFFVLTDLDKDTCAPLKISNWLSVPKHNNLFFRIAVRSVESWLIADRSSIARFLFISEGKIPNNPDLLDNPKKKLLILAERSRRTEIRDALIPQPGSTAKVGPDYNGTLIRFVMNDWNIQEASENSPSLQSAVNSIESFIPIY